MRSGIRLWRGAPRWRALGPGSSTSVEASSVRKPILAPTSTTVSPGRRNARTNTTSSLRSCGSIQSVDDMAVGKKRSTKPSHRIRNRRHSPVLASTRAATKRAGGSCCRTAAKCSCGVHRQTVGKGTVARQSYRRVFTCLPCRKVSARSAHRGPPVRHQAGLRGPPTCQPPASALHWSRLLPRPQRHASRRRAHRSCRHT